ncbi:MAG: hypothetical protein KGM46_09785 [Pseudomonadota bacterium]|jgi:hypothetical protein|nr:hypothetical protein [Xanthomonadaceae bacterium]MDE3211021.1 hypothetical protein [Pseudomonadota bacterium]
MKRRSHRLMQRKRAEIDSSSTMRRTGKLASMAGSTGLKSLDGYDWLREIERFQPRCAKDSA